jgi:hypothetical protein
VWLRGLRKLHESLCLRKPEVTSFIWSTSVNHEIIKAFFEHLKEFMLQHNFTANTICNLSETGNSTFHVLHKIICAKGIKQVWSVTSGERRINVTMIVAVNAIGNLQCWYFWECISRTLWLLVLQQLQLEMPTQQVDQRRGSVVTMWSILSQVEGLVRKTKFSWFYTIVSSCCQS